MLALSIILLAGLARPVEGDADDPLCTFQNGSCLVGGCGIQQKELGRWPLCHRTAEACCVDLNVSALYRIDKGCALAGGACMSWCGPGSVTHHHDLCVGQKCCIEDGGGKGCVDALPMSQSRVLGGNAVRACSFPWTVSIHKNVTSPFSWDSHVCAGVLVDTSTVIALAHCVKSEQMRLEEMYVVVGEHDPRVKGEAGEQIRRVSRRFINDMGGNVAVLKLERPITRSDCAKPVCLANSDLTFADNVNCTIAGFGYNGNTGSPFGSVLSSATVQLSSQQSCPKSSDSGSAQLCSDQPSSGCNGDQGSPLMCPDTNNHYVVRGIIDKVNCSDTSGVTVYTDLAIYDDWLRQYI